VEPISGAELLDETQTYPDTDFRSLLNDRGKALSDQIASAAHGCASALTGGLVDSPATATRFQDLDSLLAAPSLARSLDKANLVAAPPLGLPALIVQGIQDELAPVGQVDAFVARSCGHGAPIDYQRIPGDHVTTLPLAAASTLNFLKDRFAGLPAANTC
jgi:hypothetical protein